MKSLQAQNPLVQQIPIERFEVSEIKDDPVAFGNRTLVEGVVHEHAKQVVAALPSLGQTLQQFAPYYQFLLRNTHLSSFLPTMTARRSPFRPAQELSAAYSFQMVYSNRRPRVQVNPQADSVVFSPMR